MVNGRKMQNEVFEQVEVITHFHKLNLEIIKFKWKNDVYNVTRMNSKWKIPSGNSYVYHYTVICEMQNIICELSYDLNNFKWELVQYDNLE